MIQVLLEKKGLGIDSILVSAYKIVIQNQCQSQYNILVCRVQKQQENQNYQNAEHDARLQQVGQSRLGRRVRF